MISSRTSANAGLAAALVVLLASLSVLLAGSGWAADPRAQVGMMVPDFDLLDVDGRPFSSSTLRNGVAVVLFMSARCPASLDYTTRVLELAREHSADPRVRILAVHTPPRGGEQADPREMRVQAKVLGRQFPTLVDATGEVAERFDVGEAPVFFVIDDEGIIRYRGTFDRDRHTAHAQAALCTDAIRRLLDGELNA